uniref:Uncharacterized protein n=1 Tax=viral metagenome TaxID=1070528 RepID=A0A6C0H606_9ZZZZ
MSRFNVNQEHSLQPNSQEYMYQKKYVSIHSEDRDQIKFPNSSEFEIELPQDYLNVQSVKLSSWTFPANYSVFSANQNNLQMSFRISDPYSPQSNSYYEQLQDVIYQGLIAHIQSDFIITIEEGFYTPEQMATELTNTMNYVVTNYLDTFIQNYDLTNNTNVYSDFSGYSEFVVAYNFVNQKLWFGNKSSEFILTNDSDLYYKQDILLTCPVNKLPEFSNWGLPAYLGFTRNPITSTEIPNGTQSRFYYGDHVTGDSGYWLPLSSLPGANSYIIKAELKINLMGPAYFYMEIHGMNNIDETAPYNVSPFTSHTNETNGIVNSSFAKIAIPTTPISQWFDNNIDSYMLYNPPAERIRRLRFRLRYHNGLLVNFGNFEYSIMLELGILLPQKKVEKYVYVPETVAFG